MGSAASYIAFPHLETSHIPDNLSGSPTVHASKIFPGSGHFSLPALLQQ